MVNRIYFQFDHKSLFNFWKMFSGFKLFIFSRTFVGIRHRGALKFVSSPTLLPKIPEFWYPIAEI